MTATLTFNLPEEAAEHRLACNAALLASTVTDADQKMRNWRKHGHPFKSPEEALDYCRATLQDAVEIAG